MKDKEARESTKEHKEKIEALDRRFNHIMRELGGISIKDCPKCKHPVMTHLIGERQNGFDPVASGSWSLAMPIYQDVYQCLTCGAKLTCSEKCACELIDEEKSDKKT